MNIINTNKYDQDEIYYPSCISNYIRVVIFKKDGWEPVSQNQLLTMNIL